MPATDTEQRGLNLSIYRDGYLGDCSNSGISSRHRCVTLVDEGRSLGPSEIGADAPPVKLVLRTIYGKPYVHAEPVDRPPSGHTGWMFGGALVGSSDSRFHEEVRRLLGVDVPAVSLHDRSESPQDRDW